MGVQYSTILCLGIGVALAVSTRKRQTHQILYIILVWNAINCDTEKDSTVISIV